MTTNEALLKNGREELTELILEAASTASETSSSLSETREEQEAQSDAEAASKIAELLAGEEDEAEAPRADDAEQGGEEQGDEESNDENQPDRPAELPATLTEAAERLGMEPADLYKLTMTTGDGEDVTLGELKDAYQSREAAAHESAQRAAELDQRETALIAEQRLWGEMGESLAQSLTPQKRAELKAHLDHRDATERSRMVQAMPEMADPNAFGQFRDDAMQLLTQYGYKPHEVVVGDHRQLLILRDLMRANKRLKDLASYKPKQEKPKARKPQGRGGETSSTDAIVQRALNSPHEADHVAGIAALLSGR